MRLQSVLKMLTFVVMLCCQSVLAQSDDVKFTSEIDKTLYTLGLALSKAASNFNLTDEELKLVEAGLKDGVKNLPPKVDYLEYFPKVSRLGQLRMEITRREQVTLGAAYMQQFCSRPGAIKTVSGMAFQPIVIGSGPLPTPTSTVKINVTGFRVDGSRIGNSESLSKPITLPVSKALPCWREALQMMKVGGSSDVVCPPELTYGKNNGPLDTKPGATIRFTLELLDIIDPNPKAPR